MKVLGIAPYTFLPAQMGGQKCIDIFYRSLALEVNTTLVSVTNNEERLAKNYTLKKIFDNTKSRYVNPVYYFVLSKLIRREKITHLIIEHPYFGWLAVLLKKRTGVKFFVHSHNIESERFKSLHKKWWKILLRYEKWVHRQADFSFFITEKDLQYAVEHFKIKPQKCSTAFYGIEAAGLPTAEQKMAAKKSICQDLQIPLLTQLLLFNGAFSYPPNRDALLVLIKIIVPLLNADLFDYKLIICGKGIDKELKNSNTSNIIFKDFVPDIHIYNLAADIFLNPVIDGGGIKTKLVEALAANVRVVSARSGANGIKQEWCGDKLTVVDDNDWTAFYKAIVTKPTGDSPVSQTFFDNFYMGNIAKKVVQKLTAISL